MSQQSSCRSFPSVWILNVSHYINFSFAVVIAVVLLKPSDSGLVSGYRMGSLLKTTLHQKTSIFFDVCFGMVFLNLDVGMSVAVNMSMVPVPMDVNPNGHLYLSEKWRRYWLCLHSRLVIEISTDNMFESFLLSTKDNRCSVEWARN